MHMVMNGNGNNDSSKRSKDDTDNHGVHLSQDIIIYDILTRIPGKALSRFRCVCKPWSNLFNDPLFISLYRTRTMSRTPTGFISLERSYDNIPPIDDDNTTYNFVFFDIDKKEEKLIPFRLPDKETFGVSICDSLIYIEDSFNGLLLVAFSAVGKYEYFVYNLVTASWLYMGTSTPSQRLNHYDASLAYDPIISKYKVVRCSDKKFQILSDKLWSCVSMPEHLINDYVIEGFRNPVSVNYHLHWICRKRARVKLLRLDVSTEKVSTTNLPVKDLGLSGYRGLVEMEGLLWFFHSASNYYNVQLWYLKKKKTKNNNCGYEDDEWVMMYNINLMTEISLQQLKRSTSLSAKSRSSPVLLKYQHWANCPVFFVMDPKCKIVFTYTCVEDGHKYLCSYDTELNQGNLIYARETGQKVVAWHGNS